MAIAVLDRLKSGANAIVPAFWSVEVLNTLLVGERRGRITPEQTKAFMGTLRVLGATLDYASMEQIEGPIQAICREYALAPYDALYVELALRSGCPLATLDQAQQSAAIALGVTCL
jgi:predicted nucleic acid-binding protein